MTISSRRRINRLMQAVLCLAAAIVVAPLVFILFYVVRKGLPALSWGFFVHLPQPVGFAGAGMGNAILGTLELLGFALLIGIPTGVGAALYLSEYSSERLVNIVRFCADVLNGVPTIVTGIFVYAIVVMPMRHFSAIAGGISLAVIVLPVIARAGEQALLGVPKSYRDAALALGASRSQVIWDIVVTSAKSGLISAILLGLARIAGETAPLLFTALNNSYWNFRAGQPIASLTVQIFDYAVAPFDEWHAQAWTGALVLITMVLAVTVAARWWSGTGSPQE
jgi:phosphate transport system permease protein